MRHSEYGAFLHPCQGVQLGFHLYGVYVVAAANHEILSPAHDVHVAVAIDSADMPRLNQPVRGDLAVSFPRVPPIAGKYIGAVHLEDSKVISGIIEGAALGVVHPNLCALQRWTYGSWQSGPFVGVRSIDQGLRHSVTFQYDVTRALQKLSMRLRQQWRRTRNEHANRRGGLAIQFDLL